MEQAKGRYNRGSHQAVASNAGRRTRYSRRGSMAFEHDVVIMGGCGRVGLPLGLAFADRGLDVALFDVNTSTVERVNDGRMPFHEAGADELLPRVLEAGRLRATTDDAALSTGENVVVVIGTPIDRYLNPDISAVPRALEPVVERFV